MSEVSETPTKPATPISEIRAIEESRSKLINTRAEIKKYVEAPLAAACEHFWDLNIQTLASSANATDVGREAYIIIDYDSLSEENRRLAQERALQLVDYDGGLAINFPVPITPETTAGQIEQRFSSFAKQFKKQPAAWVPSYTLTQLAEFYGNDSDAGLKPEDFMVEGWYYDPSSQKFYHSEELFKKANEKIE